MLYLVSWNQTCPDVPATHEMILDIFGLRAWFVFDNEKDATHTMHNSDTPAILYVDTSREFLSRIGELDGNISNYPEEFRLLISQIQCVKGTLTIGKFQGQHLWEELLKEIPHV